LQTTTNTHSNFGWSGGVGNAAGTNYLRFGRFGNGGNYLRGNSKLNEYAFYDYELSAANVTTIYNSGTADDITPLSPTNWIRMGDKLTAPADAYPTIYDEAGDLVYTMTNMLITDIVNDVPS
jgi:hypothetical protein